MTATRGRRASAPASTITQINQGLTLRAAEAAASRALATGTQWLTSNQMATALGMHRSSLHRLRNADFFQEGRHFRRKNPCADRSEFLWHYERVAKLLKAI